MISYNVTVNIEQAFEQEWVSWMKSEHIPDVLETGLFTGYKFYRLLIEEQNNTTTYSIQYFLESLDHIDKYLTDFAPALQQKHIDRFQSRAVAFRTVMMEV